MGYYISKLGKVCMFGGKMTDPALDTSSLGFANSFEDKERAFYFRDELREHYPRIFLNEKQTEPKVAKSKKAEKITQAQKDDFRSYLQRQLIDNADMFWHNLSMLKPKDACDIYLKMMQYGFSRAPEERPLDAEGQARLVLEETQRKATIIAGGIPIEDEFEEE